MVQDDDHGCLGRQVLDHHRQPLEDAEPRELLGGSGAVGRGEASQHLRQILEESATETRGPNHRFVVHRRVGQPLRGRH